MTMTGLDKHAFDRMPRKPLVCSVAVEARKSDSLCAGLLMAPHPSLVYGKFVFSRMAFMPSILLHSGSGLALSCAGLQPPVIESIEWIVSHSPQEPSI